MADIDKKSWIIFLTCAFPKNKKDDIIKSLEKEKLNTRISGKKWWTEEIYNWVELKRDSKNLIERKKSLVIFE